MAGRRSPDPLSGADALLWRRVVETVRPAPGRVLPESPVGAVKVKPSRAAAIPTVPAGPIRRSPPAPPGTLDASWDRRLERGTARPDRVIDVHGDTLAKAHARIDAELAAALTAGERVVLLVTGKAGAARPSPAGTRGAIRAIVGDWLAASRHAARIAAVRPAHPRHGGAGALYVILRRR